MQHIDIDECADRNMSACSQLCVNSVGSYRCECEKGYFLEEDRKTCTKGERGETSHLSWAFSFFIQGKCVSVLRERWRQRLHAAAFFPNRCGHDSTLLWFSGRIRENVTNGSEYDRVGFCPTSREGEGRGVDLLLPSMGLSSITTFSEMTWEWKIQSAWSFWDISG